MDLLCTQDQFDDIVEAVDKVRSNAKFVKVPKDAIENLLIDHSKLLREHNDG